MIFSVGNLYHRGVFIQNFDNLSDEEIIKITEIIDNIAEKVSNSEIDKITISEIACGRLP